MLEKIKALWNLFRAGEAVSDPAKWKARQVSSNMLAAVILALVYLAKAFGVDIPVDSETATVIAAGVIAVINTVLTVTTSDKIGMRTQQQALPELQQADGDKGNQETVHVQPDTKDGQGIDDETRTRAAEWAKQQELNNPTWRDEY